MSEKKIVRTTIALRHELAALKRAEIDAVFAFMSNDAQYKSVAVAIANEFSITDWEAFKLCHPVTHPTTTI